MSFGSRLRKLRTGKGLSRADLGKLIKTHPQQIAKYEADKSQPTAQRIVAIGRALRISMDELLVGANGAKPPEIEIQDVKLYEQFRAVERLSKSDKDLVKRLIDTVILKSRIKGAIESGEQE